MDAYATHTPSCPVCQRNAGHSPRKIMRGLLTCQHCRERLVVTWSGHYVRDPFINSAESLDTCDDVARTLRRDSHPMARLGRDLGLRHPPGMLVVASSMVLLLGMGLWMWQATGSKPSVPGTPPPTALESAP